MTTYEPMHEVNDEAKVEAIAESMRESGWVGTPIVVWDNLQVTGVHRAAAAELAGIDVEAIDLADVFAEDGADFDAAVEEYQHLIGNNNSWPSAIADGMLVNLSSVICDKYGIQF